MMDTTSAFQDLVTLTRRRKNWRRIPAEHEEATVTHTRFLGSTVTGTQARDMYAALIMMPDIMVTRVGSDHVMSNGKRAPMSVVLDGFNKEKNVHVVRRNVIDVYCVVNLDKTVGGKLKLAVYINHVDRNTNEPLPSLDVLFTKGIELQQYMCRLGLITGRNK